MRSHLTSILRHAKRRIVRFWRTSRKAKSISCLVSIRRVRPIPPASTTIHFSNQIPVAGTHPANISPKALSGRCTARRQYARVDFGSGGRADVHKAADLRHIVLVPGASPRLMRRRPRSRRRSGRAGQVRNSPMRRFASPFPRLQPFQGGLNSVELPSQGGADGTTGYIGP
jgi:hypothetical protein